MSNTNDEQKLVEEILFSLIEDKCLEEKQKEVVRSKILRGDITASDWRLWIENSLLRPKAKTGSAP